MARIKRPYDVGCYLQQKGYNKNKRNSGSYTSPIAEAFIKEYYEPLEAGLLYRFEAEGNINFINLKEELDELKREYIEKK